MSAARTRANDRQVQEDLMRLEAYRGQLNTLLQQHQILSASRQDHARARESLEGIDRAEPGTEFLMPLGAESFVRGSVTRDAPVLIGIGSGIVVEMVRPKVVELLAQRLGRIDAAVRDLEGKMSQVDERIQQISARIEAAERPSGAPADVGRT